MNNCPALFCSMCNDELCQYRKGNKKKDKELQLWVCKDCPQLKYVFLPSDREVIHFYETSEYNKNRNCEHKEWKLCWTKRKWFGGFTDKDLDTTYNIWAFWKFK